MSKTKSKRLVQWFGSNTENAAEVGRLLEGCKFVAIPFAGGMSEVPFITAKQILANDKHRLLINLCMVVTSPPHCHWLQQEADALPYHPDVLARAQRACREFVSTMMGNPDAALWYFVAVWMGRGGKAGTSGEFDGALPLRWNANGGGSNRRYRTAIEALEEWGRTFRRCEFDCRDAFEFLGKLHDEPGHGIYVDAPWPDAGEEYLHRFTEDDQIHLASTLVQFSEARVVVRYGEHPLIRALYKEENGWTWIGNQSRDQANQVKAEWLICRNLPGVTP